MNLFPPTIILRHRKENLNKCSLRGLETREDLIFFTYPQDNLPEVSSYLLLSLGAPPLTIDDAKLGIFLVDGTWKYAEVMCKKVNSPLRLAARSLPEGLETAYPRVQTGCSDPARGLASIEALYATYRILGRDPKGLLDFYYWKDLFLEKNKDFFKALN